MAYDEGLATRVREFLGDHPKLVERKMFGGLAMLVYGNMACGVLGEDLIVRVDPEAYDELLAEPGARVFDFTGRPMRGILVVQHEACAEDEDLRRWLRRGVDHAQRLPPK